MSFPEAIYPQLEAIKRARYRGALPDTALETWANRAFSADRRLVIYGTLAPGQSNHHVVEPVPGVWTEGIHVEGERFELGWGSDMGYPGFTWIPGGPSVSGWLLKAEALPEHWDRLDRFEGPQYCRILIPVFLGRDFLTVANIYEARSEV